MSFQFYHPDPKTGKESQYYTIELTHATVSNLRQEMVNNKYPDNGKHEFREHISFTYQSITWTNNEGDTTAADDWVVSDKE